MAVVVAGRSEGGRRRVGSHPRRTLAVVVATAAIVATGAFVSTRDRGGTASPGGPLLLGIADLTYSTTSLRSTPGEVHLAVANTDAVPHTVTIEALEVDLRIGSGEAIETTFTAAPGTYAFICTIPGHDGPGMRGVLTVHD